MFDSVCAFLNRNGGHLLLGVGDRGNIVEIDKSSIENIIYPFANLSDLRSDVFIKVRRLASNQKGNHPWQYMSDMELLKSAGLYLKDLQSGKEGITLSGILLFGSDEVILSALPHFKTDAILRKEDIDRYMEMELLILIIFLLILRILRLLNFLKK